MCGLGGILCFSNIHFIVFKENMGSGTNNRVKLMALRALIKLALSRRIQKLQLFCDSLSVIKWMRREQAL